MQVTHDKKLLIAIGRSRKAAQWQNREMLWSEFLDKLANTTRTRETVNDYAAMTKAERDNVKDVGGFVGGYLKNGRRSSASVVNRCLICLDADSADAGLLDDLDMTFINAYALYSTHSHTPEKMRLRLIVPLSRTVTPDEYAAVSRRVADDLTLSRFDPTTFEPARLMYWPSTPEDGEFVFRYADQPFLDPDEVLATYADWQDASLWPTTQPVEAKMRRSVSKQEDPLTKRGIIGAFCRAHSITDILENVLSDRYTSTTQDDRYTFVGGSTTGGLVVYDDKYAFSHHATDPAGGKLCNAFDLVRWHLFTPGGTAPDGSRVGDENASIRRMQEYAAQDEATRRTLSEERREQAALEFGDLDALEAQPAQAQFTDENWQEKLEVDKQGRVKDTLGNLALILRNDPRLKDIAYNIHRSGIDIRRDAEGRTHAALDAHQARLERVRPRVAADLSRSRVHALHAGKAQKHPAGHRHRAQLPSHPRLHRIAARVGRRAQGGHAVRGLSGRGGYGLHPRRGAEDAGGSHRARVPAGHQVRQRSCAQWPAGHGQEFVLCQAGWEVVQRFSHHRRHEGQGRAGKAAGAVDTGAG